MSLLLIKTFTDEDFYVLWTTISDGPLAWGSRKQLTAKPVFKDVVVRVSRRVLRQPYTKLWWEIANTAFKEADANGSSIFTGVEGFFNWDEDDELVYAHGGGRNFVTREQFGSFMDAYKRFSDIDMNHPNILQHTTNEEGHVHD